MDWGLPVKPWRTSAPRASPVAEYGSAPGMMGASRIGQPTGEKTMVPAARAPRAEGRTRSHTRPKSDTKEHPTCRVPVPQRRLVGRGPRIRAEFEGKTLPIAHSVRMNLVVTAVPFGDEDIHAHMDTSSGEMVLDTGHLETQDLKVTVDYDTAKAILIDGNPQAGMQAFMAGKVRVEGDMAKLMALQATPAAADS